MNRALLRGGVAVAVLACTVGTAALLAGGQHSTGARSAAPLLDNDASPLLRIRQPFHPVRAPYVGDRLRAAGDPTFGQATIVGVQGYGFEEDIRLDPTSSNRIYTSTPDSLSSNTSWIWHSEDGGKTFKWVRAALPGNSPVTPGKPTALACAGGGDTELGVDSAGHLYFNDLTLVNFSVYRSDDHGQTFLCNNTGVPDAVVDRQWYAIDGDPVGGSAPAPSTNSIYLANDEIGPGAPMCGSSAGNNVLVMYRSPIGAIPNASAGLQFGPRQTVTALLTCDEGIMGNNEVSPVATTLNDANPGMPLATAVRHVYVVHDNAAFDQIAMGRCTPVAVTTDPSGLQCTDHVIASFPGGGTRHTGANFPAMAIDNAGTLYAIWTYAPTAGGHVGDSALMYSYSTTEGNTWSAPAQIATGLSNNVFAWPAAGDAGRVDVMFLGTAAHVNPANPTCPDGPDSINGAWNVYMVQSLAANTGAPQWTSAVPVVNHPIHKGNIQTVVGGQCSGSDRTLGDFFQLRIGTQGEANISFADSNNIDEVFAPHAMFARQNGGNSLYTSVGTVSLPAAPTNSVSDVSGDGIYEASGLASSSSPDLDITGSSVQKPAAASCAGGIACYRVTMTVNDLTAAPVAPAPDIDPYVQWLTQWLVPSDPSCMSAAAPCVNGGTNFMVYAESQLGGAISCSDGENGALLNGGGVTLTYVGAHPITGAACNANTTTNTITIDVPIADVTLAGGVAPFNATRLYSVTASTTSSLAAFNSTPNLNGIGGVLFNLLDVAPGYDAVFGGATAVRIVSFVVRPSGKAVVLRWRTASENGLAGFNVYRGSTRLNRTLIRAAGTLVGHGYSFRAIAASPNSRYRLQAVGTDGSRAWVGHVG
jgi:hypothetical protein